MRRFYGVVLVSVINNKNMFVKLTEYVVKHQILKL